MRYRITRFRELGSTNDVALDAATAGAQPGLVVRADVQARGKGRKTRDWSSPPGGLWASVLLSPEVPSVHQGLIPLAVGCACAEALEQLGIDVGVRWPNDLMLGDRKVGGILVEGRVLGSALSHVVAGMGINVQNPPPVDGAASLGEVAADLTPGQLLDGILDRLATYEDALGRADAKLLCQRFMRYAWGIDRELLLDGELCRPKEIAIDGALVLQRPDGSIDIARTGSLRLPDQG